MNIEIDIDVVGKLQGNGGMSIVATIFAALLQGRGFYRCREKSNANACDISSSGHSLVRLALE